MPVDPVLETPVILAGSFATAWLINARLAPPLVPAMIRLESFISSLVFFCWLWRLCPKRAEDAEATGGALQKVQAAIRRLTGQDPGPADRLEAVGLDSFGVTALVANLRKDFAKARDLRVTMLQDLETVGALAAFLEEGAEGKKDK